MAVKKRQCGTCRFFVKSETNPHGSCSNPAWPESSAPLLMLRPTELACRTRWGTSLWQDPSDTSEPDHQDTPQQPSLPEPVSVQLQFDDEVTSVSIAGSDRARPSFEDDVVDTAAAKPGMSFWNDEIQSERRELLRQSPHEALAGARKRHIDKQARQRELIPFADDELASQTLPEAEPQSDENAVLESTAAVRDPFPADDFVEVERGSSETVSANSDEIVDEGLPGPRRSPRLNHLLRKDDFPKANKAMSLGASAEISVTPNNPDYRAQWNTVPQIEPGFDLPLSEPQSTLPAMNMRVAASAATATTFSYSSRPVSTAREMVAEDRLKSERARRHVSVPMAEDRSLRPTPPEESVGRPMLTQAPSQQAAIVDRIKSSPLRGYHPATKLERDQSNQLSIAAPVSGEPRLPENRTDTHQVQRAPREDFGNREEATQPPASPRPYIPLQSMSEPFVGSEIEISPDVPRRCGTCSSFRRSDVKGRGSCTNQFAGPVQRVVFESDLACQHTFGCFWLPNDKHVWLKKLPVFDAPTLRVDAMMARRERRNRTVLPDIDEMTS